MKQRSTVLVGAMAGGLLGVVFLTLFAGRNAMGSVSLAPGGDAELVVRSGALYLATVTSALIGGVAVSGIAYSLSSISDADTPRFELAHVLPFGLVAATAAGYSILRAGLGLTGDITAGDATITAPALVLTTLVGGLVAGAVTSWVVSTLASKSVVGLVGEAAPTSTAAMMRAAMHAVTGPMIAIVVIAVLAISFAQLLLAAEGDAAIAIFGVAGALVLAGAAAAAYLGGNDKPAG